MDIQGFIKQQLPAQQEIIKRLRKIILATDPEIEEKLTYGNPFYYYQGRLCYIKPRKELIDLGFCRGVDMVGDYKVLEKKGRAEVATISYKEAADIKEEELKEILKEAIMMNEFYDIRRR